MYGKYKLNWQPRDERTASEMERIRQNIETIRAAYFTPDSTPITPSEITYTSIYQANAIEQIIYDIGRLIEAAYPAHQRFAFKLGTRAFGERKGAF